MLAKVQTGAIIGLDGAVVEVETDISSGLPVFNVVGLPDAAVQEARERVRAAIRNSGAEFPMRRIVVNLAPADLKKAGPSYDLPIAVGLLLSSRQVDAVVSDVMFLGELSLDGGLRHTSGILPLVALARQEGFSNVVVPAADGREAALVEGITVIPVESLRDLIAWLRGELPMPTVAPASGALTEDMDFFNAVDLAHVKGQEHVKRALEVAAAGAHNVIMSGPPGSGKTLLARALPSILPPMTSEEALDVTRIYSVAGLLPPETPLLRRRPFRAPHHTISNAGLVGGGHWPRPGEVSLSQLGITQSD